MRASTFGRLPSLVFDQIEDCLADEILVSDRGILSEADGTILKNPYEFVVSRARKPKPVECHSSRALRPSPRR
jgi:hypothetical protein